MIFFKCMFGNWIKFKGRFQKFDMIVETLLKNLSFEVSIHFYCWSIFYTIYHI